MDNDQAFLFCESENEADDDDSNESRSVVERPAERVPNFNFRSSRLNLALKCILLVVATAALLIYLPVYIHKVTYSGKVNIHLGLCTAALISSLVLLFGTMYARCVANCSTWSSLPHPVVVGKTWSVVALGVVHGLVAIAIFYSWDRMRVICHLQDPLMVLAVLFGAIGHLVERHRRKKALGFRRTFSLVTIVAGLFVAVDYQLCDEYRCRGNTKKQHVDFDGPWSWFAHLTWTLAYSSAMGLFAVETSAFEAVFKKIAHFKPVRSSVLTVSGPLDSVEPVRSPPPATIVSNPFIVMLEWVTCVHMVAFGVILSCVWIGWIPGIRSGVTISSVVPLKCLFGASSEIDCSLMTAHEWIFPLVYSLAVVAFFQLLLATSSAVFTLATASVAIPLCGIWWSIFSYTGGNLILSPAITGEMICSVLGLPVVVTGTILFFRYDWSDGHGGLPLVA